MVVEVAAVISIMRLTQEADSGCIAMKAVARQCKTQTQCKGRCTQSSNMASRHEEHPIATTQHVRRQELREKMRAWLAEQVKQRAGVGFRIRIFLLTLALVCQIGGKVVETSS